MYKCSLFAKEEKNTGEESPDRMSYVRYTPMRMSYVFS